MLSILKAQFRRFQRNELADFREWLDWKRRRLIWRLRGSKPDPRGEDWVALDWYASSPQGGFRIAWTGKGNIDESWTYDENGNKVVTRR